MSYQQGTNHTETSFHNRTASNMYQQNQARVQRDSQGQAAQFAQSAMPPSQNDNQAMAAMMSQFAGMTAGMAAGLPAPTANMTSTTNVGATPQLPAGQYYYNPSDNTYLVAPVYPPQTLAATQPTESAYGAYASALPYFPSGAYPGYLPAGFPLMPYTPNRASSGYYPDRVEQLYKELPGLENRRGSYSTNESVPGTPHYGLVAHGDRGAQIAAVDRSPFGSTPSPQTLTLQHVDQQAVKPLPYKTIPINVDLDGLIARDPTIPRAVPAVFTPRENMRTLDQSLSNPIPGNRNVYLRGLHPETNDETLAAYAARFGKVETSKAIIDTSTGLCKGFGFAKYHTVRDSELCIRGFYKLGYEVGFARESFNSRLKAEGDESSTNLYVSNLPKNMTESELGAIFMDYTVQSSRILRDSQNSSRGVGFARFESREVCEEIICKFHGQPIGEEGLLLQVRYADTPAQKDLKRITTERRQFRTQEYNVGAYGTTPSEMLTLSPPASSPVVPRASQIARHFPTGGSRASGSWKRDNNSISSGPFFKDLDRQANASASECTPEKSNNVIAGTTPTISEDGSADDGVTVHNQSPVVAHGGTSHSPSARKA